MDDLELETRRAEKRAEKPMAPSLKHLAMNAARETARMIAEAKVTTLCECPGHVHNLWDALCMADALDYGHQIAQVRTQVAVDVPHQLRRAGCPENAISRINHGGLDERPSLFAARVWLGIEPERLGVQGKHAQLQVRAQQTRQTRRPYLAMFGTTDRGKTLAAVYAMGAAMRKHGWNTGSTGQHQGPPFAFVRFTEIAGVLAWDAPTRVWLDNLKRAKLLILDDMGKEHLTSVAQMLLFELLDTRYAQGLDTVITSQLKVSEFQLKYDGPIGPDGKPGALYRRLRERGLILRDGGEQAGAILMAGDTDLKKWPGKKDGP